MSLETIWLKSAHNLLTVLSSQRFFIFRHCDLYSDTAFFILFLLNGNVYQILQKEQNV